MAVDLFADYYQWTVTAGGTTAPAGGTSESWTVSSSTGAPPASNTATPPTQFRVVDAADTNKPPEVCLVTNVSGTTWTVTRGAEGATPWAHAANFTAVPVLTSTAMTSVSQGVPLWGYAVPSGRYLRLPVYWAIQNGSTLGTNGLLAALPLALSSSTTLTSLGIILFGSNGSAGSVVRVGIYNDSSGYPGSLVLDAGTFTTTAGANGLVNIAISQALGAGTYWVVAVPQGSPATNPGILMVTGGGPGTLYDPTGGGARVLVGWSLTGVTGALPSPFTAGASPLDDNSTFYSIVVGA